MDDQIEDAITPPKGIWNKTREIVSSPVTAITKLTKESPAMVLIAILLIVQPIVQTGLDLMRSFIEFRQDLDPNNRPVTKAELDVINSKIDFLEKLVLANTQADQERLNRQDVWMDSRKKGAIPAPLPTPSAPPVVVAPPPNIGYDSLNKKLNDVSKKADEEFKEHPPKK